MLAIVLAAFLAVTPPILRVAYPSAVRQRVVGALPLPPQPRLEVKPRDSLAALHAREDELLRSYGWTNRAHGVVRIPIDRAMALLAQRGLPGWPAQATDEK
jgi:hypothetical protein